MADLKIQGSAPIMPLGQKTEIKLPDNKNNPPANSEELPQDALKLETKSAKPMETIRFDSPEKETKKSVTERKGRLDIAWGYGWQHFAQSDIHFSGPGHDFTLHGVRAQDRPSPFSFDVYFNPAKLSIPQYMLDLNYYVSDKVFVRLGQHHMKYVMDQDQMAPITGSISADRDPVHAGNYNGEFIKVTDIVQQLEHTDGLNDVHTGLGVNMPLWTSPNGKHALSMTAEATVGVVVPKSDVRLFGEGENHAFKAAGYSFSTGTGLRVDLFRNFFAEGRLNAGYINLTNFTTSGRPEDKGSQEIRYLNPYFTVGYSLPLNRK